MKKNPKNFSLILIDDEGTELRILDHTSLIECLFTISKLEDNLRRNAFILDHSSDLFVDKVNIDYLNGRIRYSHIVSDPQDIATKYPL